MKKYLGLMVALAIMATLGLGTVASAATTQAPMSGGGALSYYCPVCGQVLVFGVDVKFVKTNDSFWGFERVDTQIKCPKCGYFNGKDGRGNLITPATEQMKFNLGMKNWPINQK